MSNSDDQYTFYSVIDDEGKVIVPLNDSLGIYPTRKMAAGVRSNLLDQTRKMLARRNLPEGVRTLQKNEAFRRSKFTVRPVRIVDEGTADVRISPVFYGVITLDNSILKGMCRRMHGLFADKADADKNLEYLLSCVEQSIKYYKSVGDTVGLDKINNYKEELRLSEVEPVELIISE